ncbi:MAG TPA: DUF4870 domain-containing protein [Pyrinomonadaceae bacterium]|jgi:uncharacterized membrane protein
MNQYPPQPGYDFPPPPPPPGTPPGAPGGKTSLGLDENVAAMLCYLTMLCCGLGIIVSLVFFLTEKTSRFVRFHALQGLLFGGLWIAIGFVFGILQVILNAADMGILGVGLIGIRAVIGLVLIVFLILAAVKAYQREIYKLPLIGDMAENIIGR